MVHQLLSRILEQDRAQSFSKIIAVRIIRDQVDLVGMVNPESKRYSSFKLVLLEYRTLLNSGGGAKISQDSDANRIDGHTIGTGKNQTRVS